MLIYLFLGENKIKNKRAVPIFYSHFHSSNPPETLEMKIKFLSRLLVVSRQGRG